MWRKFPNNTPNLFYYVSYKSRIPEYMSFRTKVVKRRVRGHKGRRQEGCLDQKMGPKTVSPNI